LVQVCCLSGLGKDRFRLLAQRLVLWRGRGGEGDRGAHAARAPREEREQRSPPLAVRLLGRHMRGVRRHTATGNGAAARWKRAVVDQYARSPRRGAEHLDQSFLSLTRRVGSEDVGNAPRCLLAPRGAGSEDEAIARTERGTPQGNARLGVQPKWP